MLEEKFHLEIYSFDDELLILMILLCTFYQYIR